MTKYGRPLGIVMAMLVLGSMAACTKDAGGTSAAPGAGTDVTASSPAATAGAQPSKAAPAATASFPKTAGAYATAAVTAWSAGDANRLGQLTSSGSSVFAALSAGDFNTSFHLYRCTGAAGSSICTLYNKAGDWLDLRLQNSLVGQPHAVVDGHWRPITFPEDLKAYAQQTLTAWTGHNSAAVALLTGKPDDSAFDEVPPARRNESWTFDHDEGATGHLYFAFVDPAGDSITFGFANPGFGPVPANRHGLVQSVYYAAH